MVNKQCLIIQCSQTKANIERGMARELYRGQVMILGLRYADKFGLEPLILSGKYGIIKPTDIIDNYNLKSPKYIGEWPTKSGWWLGGKDYFKNAPSHLLPLITGHRGYGDMKNWLGKRINGTV